jgi:hypothetical protein
MTKYKQTAAPKNTRIQYSQSYNDDALTLAECIGVSKAAIQLGILESQLNYFRNNHRLQQNKMYSILNTKLPVCI